MIYVIIYSKKADEIQTVKAHIEKYCTDVDCTFLSFEYPMDILDYLNTSRPRKCAVFFSSDNYSEGIEISRKINEINPRYRFTLLCSEYDKAENLFYNGVTYYIKTPCSSDSLMRCSLFIKKYYEEKSGKTLQLKSRNETANILLSEINYIMSDKRKIIISTVASEKTYYYKLDEIETMLSDGFLRCHQSYIVNMSRIKQFVEDGIILTDETFIPASRKRYYASKREYLSYITGNKTV